MKKKSFLSPVSWQAVSLDLQKGCCSGCQPNYPVM